MLTDTGGGERWRERGRELAHTAPSVVPAKYHLTHVYRERAWKEGRGEYINIEY